MVTAATLFPTLMLGITGSPVDASSSDIVGWKWHDSSHPTNLTPASFLTESRHQNLTAGLSVVEASPLSRLLDATDNDFTYAASYADRSNIPTNTLA